MKKQILFFFTFICLATFTTVFAQTPLNPSWLLSPKNTQPLGGPNYANATVVDATGNIYVTGAYAGITDFDPSPDSLNVTSTPNYDNNWGLTPDSYDIFVAKYDQAGALLWVVTAGDYGDDIGTNIALDAAGNVVVTGHFRHTINFEPTNPALALVSDGPVDDIFLAKFDANGNHIWSKSMGGISTDRAYGLATDQSNNIYISGEFWLTANFDPNGNAPLTSKGAVDIFFAKYDLDGNYIWAKGMGGTSSGDTAMDIAVDTDSNVYLTGSFKYTVDFDPNGSGGTAELTSIGLNDIFLAKYDLNGAYIWAKGFGVSGEYSRGQHIAFDSQQDVYLTGDFKRTIVFDALDPNGTISSMNNSQDLFLAKFEKNGDFVWVNGLGSGMVDNGRKVAVAGDKVLLMGNFSSSFYPDPNNAAVYISGGQSSTFIASYETTNGAYVWAKAISTADARGFAVKNSLLHILGTFRGNVDFDPSPQNATLSAIHPAQDIFIATYTLAAGDYNTAFKFSDYPKVDLVETATEIKHDANRNIIVTGKFSGELNFDPNGSAPQKVLNQNGSSLSQDGYVAKYNEFGEYVWARVFGGINEDIPSSVAVDSDGNIYVTGVFQKTAFFDLPNQSSGYLSNPTTASSTFIVKYDPNGTFLWVKKLNSTTSINAGSIALGPDDTIYLAGSFRGTANFDPAGLENLSSNGTASDGFLAKYDSDGNYLWAHRLGGTGSDGASTVAVNSSGEAYLGGSYNSPYTNNFTFSNSSTSLKSKGDNDMFIVKYAEDGSFIWSHSIGGSQHDRIFSIALDSAEDLYVSGSFMGKVNFRTPSSPYELESDANPQLSNAFIAKFTKGASLVWARGIFGSYNSAVSVAVDHQDNVYTVGHFGDVATFSPSVTLSAVPKFANGYAAKYSPTGTILAVKQFESSLNTYGTAISVNNAGDVVAGGNFRRTLTVGTETGPLSSTSINSVDMFLVKFQRESVLPVTLTNFTATKANDYAKLTWQTSSEINNKEFVVLRAADGVTFKEIGRVAGAGNSNEQKSYTFNDRSPLDGINYYKLVQYDFNNTAVDHGVKTVSFNLASEITIYPNPTTNKVQVTLGAHQYRSAKLYNSTGILLQDVAISTLQETLNISLENYPKGIYILKMESDTDVSVKKIIKE